MNEETTNKKTQKIIFTISLLLIIFGIITIIIDGFANLFKFSNMSQQPLTTKQQPFFILLIFAAIALFFSGRNLKRIKDKEKR